MNLQKLKEKIAEEKYKVISFDIFDTLIKRPCVSPTDILKLVGKRCNYQGDFLSMRRIAEKEARRNKLFWEDEISYDDIYNEFEALFDVTHEEIERFKSCELDIELEYLSPRKSMHDIFEYSKSIGKEVILVSDIYLPYDFMDKVLKKCGYDDYSKLYLSSEYKLCKNTGKLYEIVKEDYLQKGIQAQEILHMGDNENSDVNIAKGHGLSVEFIPRIEWMFKKNRQLSILYNYEVTSRYADDTFLMGWAINQIYDDPFVNFNNNTFFNGDISVMVNMLVAPLILSYYKLSLQNEINNKSSMVTFIGKKRNFAKRIFDTIKLAYSKKIDSKVIESVNSMEIIESGAYFGTENDLQLINEKELHLGKDVRYYSPYVSSPQYYCNDGIYKKCGMVFDYDTNRTFPIMHCLINSILFDETNDKTICEIRIQVEKYIKSFIKSFINDFEYIVCDFTLYNEFYMRFLSAAKEVDAALLKDISICNNTLYNKNKTNLYIQWYKNHQKN